MAGTAVLTVQSLNGSSQISMQFNESQSVFELRQRFADAVGMVRVRKGLKHDGRVLTNNRAVTDLLGLTPHDVISDSSSKPARMLDIWSFHNTAHLGSLEERREDEDLGFGEDRSSQVWEVHTIACLESDFGSGFVLFGSD
mmetsp:Transcript_50026/g.93651  ORF Transcript_50026/g.93651 Transcript_50026/m.93651 type:complete len:141 (-) Transcript_50026:160-582(-)